MESKSSESESKDHTTMNQIRTYQAGVAKVKEEFLVRGLKPKIQTEYLSSDTKEKLEEFAKNDEDNGEEPKKKKFKLRRRNKKRAEIFKVQAFQKLCPSVIHEKECSFKGSCKFDHDVASFMANRPKDIGDRCHNFETFGKCTYGLSCKFGMCHISEDYKNIVDNDLYTKTTKNPIFFNILEKDLQQSLWKKRYDFSKANRNAAKIVEMCKSKGNNSKNVVNVAEDKSDGIGEDRDLQPAVHDLQQIGAEIKSMGNESSSERCSEEMVSGTTTCDHSGEESRVCGTSRNSNDMEGIKLRPQEKKLIDFTNKLYLAPLTTVGNLPFRRVCKEFGTDITCSEMALGLDILQGKKSEWALLKRHASEDLFGIQVCGAFPDVMGRCCQLLNDEMKVDFVDLNCGCPIELVYRKGEGCALMGKTTRFEQVIRSMKSVLDVPLTVKMRTGIEESKNIAHKLAPKLHDMGVSLLTIHGRSREQRYTRLADWDYIDECAKLARPVPVFGNGDILSYEDLDYHLKHRTVSGGMIARGALIKPWIFTELKERRHWDISAQERFDMLKRFVNYGLEVWGSDLEGVERTRRFLLEWLSFTHRYIPVGLLEQVPQKINERPPYYIGRSDLETLLSSANCGDWVKISTMLLGKTPEGFSFLPKHKANAYVLTADN